MLDATILIRKMRQNSCNGNGYRNVGVFIPVTGTDWVFFPVTVTGTGRVFKPATGTVTDSGFVTVTGNEQRRSDLDERYADICYRIRPAMNLKRRY